jgi:hypothetical protein
MADRFAGMGEDLLGPATRAVAAATSDTVALPNVSKRLWVGGAGNVKLVTLGGDTVIYTAVPAGTYLNVRATQIFATLTTASNIIVEF